MLDKAAVFVGFQLAEIVLQRFAIYTNKLGKLSNTQKLTHKTMLLPAVFL